MFRTVVNGFGESEVVPLPNPRVIMLLGERPKPSPRVSVPIAIPPYVARTTEVGALLELYVNVAAVVEASSFFAVPVVALIA